MVPKINDGLKNNNWMVLLFLFIEVNVENDCGFTFIIIVLHCIVLISTLQCPAQVYSNMCYYDVISYTAIVLYKSVAIINLQYNASLAGIVSQVNTHYSDVKFAGLAPLNGNM